MATAFKSECQWGAGGFVGLLFDNVTGLVTGVRYTNPDPAPQLITIVAVAPFSPTGRFPIDIPANAPQTDVLTTRSGQTISSFGINMQPVTITKPDGSTFTGWRNPPGISFAC